jgi:hypothetical protein
VSGDVVTFLDRWSYSPLCESFTIQEGTMKKIVIHRAGTVNLVGKASAKHSG